MQPRWNGAKDNLRALSGWLTFGGKSVNYPSEIDIIFLGPELEDWT